jgi:outer membrane protein insertion porin family
VRDSRDNIFDATRGSYNILSLTMAGGYLGGDRHFVKPVFDTRLHFTTPAIFGMQWLKKFVLGLHGRIGYASPYDAGPPGQNEVPVSERFFMGGTDTVRGYNERDLGASRIGGGLFTLLSNVEYGFKPAPPIKLRAFYDSGNAWADVNSVDRGSDGNYKPFLYPSAGIGMLFTIPTSVIQIRLDYGWPLVEAGSDMHGKLHFNIGNIF